MKAKKSTEAKAKRQEQSIIKELSMAEVYDFLMQEDETGKGRRVQQLLKKHFKDAMSESKTSTMSRMDLLDRGLGKPKQSNDITSGGKPINTVVFDIFGDDSSQE